MGHPQVPMPMQTDNSMAPGIINETIKQRRYIAIDKRFYWVRDRYKQTKFLVYWAPGKYNMGNYHTNLNSPSHYKKQRPLHVHSEKSPQYIPWNTIILQHGCVKQSPSLNRINMFPGGFYYHNPECGGYNNQERTDILRVKLLATHVALLGAHPYTVHSIHDILWMSINRNKIKAKNRVALNCNSYQLEQLFATPQTERTFYNTVFNFYSIQLLL